MMETTDAGRIIETERLRLRLHRMEDFDSYHTSVWGDPAVTRYVGGRPHTPEESWSRLLRYAGHWSLLGYGFWAVEEKATGRLVGDVGFSDFRRGLDPSLNFGTAPEIGWVLAASMHGKGYATEAVRAALAWGEQNLKARRFVCMIHPDNQASARVAEKTGFVAYAQTDYKDAPVRLYERLGE